MAGFPDKLDFNDFGFTAVDDPYASAEAIAQARVDRDLSEKLNQLEGLIIPLLQNLMKNPEKEYILWPNRQEQIQKQMDKILAITRSRN